jgi:hypothetical protein
MTRDMASRLRVRYLIAGAVFAVLWIGHASEPAWAHALRVGLVLITVRPLVMLSRRYYARHWSSQASQTRGIAILIAIRILALVAALVAGTLIEKLVAHQSYSVHSLTVLRFALLVVTIPIQVRFLRSRAGAAALSRVRWNWLFVAKAALVLAALGAQILLDGIMGKPADLVVAAGLLISIAVLGPMLHGRMFGSRQFRVAAAPPRDDREADVSPASP